MDHSQPEPLYYPCHTVMMYGDFWYSHQEN